MPKLIVVILAILVSAVVQRFIDKACGVDYSKTTRAKAIAHGVVYMLCGAAIYAAVL